LAPDAGRWRQFQEVFASVVQDAGYQLIIPPMFEDLGVFLRLGEATEVVTKEMYDFEDKGGRRVALRPEQTASVCRAFVEHRPTTPWKVWYSDLIFVMRNHNRVDIDNLIKSVSKCSVSMIHC
jgi:histidyl-tRNA synthetase